MVLGGFLTLTHSHLHHCWHFPTIVGFCHGGNMLGNHDQHNYYDDPWPTYPWASLLKNTQDEQLKLQSVCPRRDPRGCRSDSVVNQFYKEYKDSTCKWNCDEYISGCYLDPDNKNGDGNCNKSRCVGHSIGGALHLLCYYIIMLLYYYYHSIDRTLHLCKYCF